MAGHRRSVRVAILSAVVALVATACSSDGSNSTSAVPDSVSLDQTTTTEAEELVEPVEVPTAVEGTERDFGDPPSIPDGDLSDDMVAALDSVFLTGFDDGLLLLEEMDALRSLGESDDPRIAWLFADALRFIREPDMVASFTGGVSNLLDTEISPFSAWHDTTDHLIAWDIPAPPNYLQYKRALFTLFEPGWEPLMVDGDIDWRHVSWGGVRIDDRAYNTTHTQCDCIPATDNPEVSSAVDAEWLADDAVVFGVEINGESRAYPRRIMEVREMVNDTLGGRDFAMPYCTLCGAAQVYLTDDLPGDIGRPILRTSGLLIRSNKVMYDLTSGSVFDTFRGNAVTGPLLEEGIVLEQVTVTTSSWADWKREHPDTTVLREELALGRDFDFRNGRDADGPIFPIGDVDPRLPVQEDIFGVIVDGQAIGFHADIAMATLRNRDRVEVGGVHLELDGAGLRAFNGDGNEIAGHQAFWFAWSQFYPDTELWIG